VRLYNGYLKPVNDEIIAKKEENVIKIGW